MLLFFFSSSFLFLEPWGQLTTPFLNKMYFSFIYFTIFNFSFSKVSIFCFSFPLSKKLKIFFSWVFIFTRNHKLKINNYHFIFFISVSFSFPFSKNVLLFLSSFFCVCVFTCKKTNKKMCFCLWVFNFPQKL